MIYIEDSNLEVKLTVIYLKVSAIYPNGSLGQGKTADKAEVQRPDAWVLSNRKSSEGTVKCLATSCYLTLRHKELAVI